MLMFTPANSKLLLYQIYSSCFFLICCHVAADAASALSFSFDFSEASSYRIGDLRFEGSAGVQDGLVDLTCNLSAESMTNCMGRMSYQHPVTFYNTTTGEVASFATRFKFAIKVINSDAGKLRGDGMAFFLCSYPLVMPSTAFGGSLGLHHDGDAFDPEQFVAVEFDPWQNSFDKDPFDHIGIDINSVGNSANTTGLANFSLNGDMTADITFNGSTRMLVATLTFDYNHSLGPAQVSTQLTDPVTALLPSEVAVGFSAATGSHIELHQVMSWSFNSTLAPKGVTSHVIPRQLIIGGASVLLIILVVVIWSGMAYFKHIRHGDAFLKGAADLAKRFEYGELAAATEKFSTSRELGRGAFGVVYGGELKGKDGQQHRVAVKKIKGSNGDTEDFHAELNTISETRHKNLVRLMGWCSRNRSNFIDFMCWCRHKQSAELFLVYELVPNGNLDTHLHKNEQVLSWEKRYKIVKDIGSALRYLHNECNKCILHRDIKPGNILLDENFNAKLADFGLSRIAHHKNEELLTTASEMLGGDLNANAVALTKAEGTMAYMDPKCMTHGIVSVNCRFDVYSFGIVLLEIACTRKSRVEVWDLYKCNQENMAVAADPRLDGDFKVAQMHHVAVLGLWCSFPDDARRPTLVQAMEVLEHDATLPNLIEYERGVGGSEGYYPVASSAKREFLGNGQQSSRAILSYEKLGPVSETDTIM